MNDFHFSISHYSTTSTSSASYIIGGFLSPNIIAQYKHGQWSKVGDLSTGRYGHASITDGVQTIIIGGNVSGWVFVSSKLNSELPKNHECIIEIDHIRFTSGQTSDQNLLFRNLYCTKSCVISSLRNLYTSLPTIKEKHLIDTTVN